MILSRSVDFHPPSGWISAENPGIPHDLISKNGSIRMTHVDSGRKQVELFYMIELRNHASRRCTFGHAFFLSQVPCPRQSREPVRCQVPEVAPGYTVEGCEILGFNHSSIPPVVQDLPSTVWNGSFWKPRNEWIRLSLVFRIGRMGCHQSARSIGHSCGKKSSN